MAVTGKPVFSRLAAAPANGIVRHRLHTGFRPRSVEPRNRIVRICCRCSCAAMPPWRKSRGRLGATVSGAAHLVSTLFPVIGMQHYLTESEFLNEISQACREHQPYDSSTAFSTLPITGLSWTGRHGILQKPDFVLVWFVLEQLDVELDGADLTAG